MFLIPDYVIRIWSHLNQRRKRQTTFIFLLILISALAEVFSLGIVLPFIGALISPDKVFNAPYIADFLVFFEITSADQLAYPLTIIFIFLTSVATGIRVLLLWSSSRLAAVIGSDFSVKAYQRTLYQPYSVHINRNSSEVISTLVAKVTSATTVINLILGIMSSVIVIFFITIALFIVNPEVSLITVSSFGIVYVIISRRVKGKLQNNSVNIERSYNASFKLLQEGLGGIRDIIMSGVQPIYTDIYGKVDRSLRIAQGDNIFIIGSPRFIIEAFGMIFIAIVAYTSSLQPEGFTGILPIIAALAIGAQRLLPSMQRVFSGLNGIVGHKDSLIAVLDLLDQRCLENFQKKPLKTLNFKNNICFNSINFSYNDDAWSINNFKLIINKGDSIGIVGKTASGKSTVVDLLMGLLSPDKGEVLIDDIPVTNKNLSHWQQSISHVPQNIYLSDSTILENIAFGVNYEDIDLDRVEYAATCANIHDTILKYDNGYQTMIGECGVRLSGGQRQRLGIARALYKKSDIIIFDEATSALDTVTEGAIIDSMKELDTNLTIIMIAHRISTIRHCDKIIEMDQGSIVSQGTYEQILKSSDSFRKLNSINSNN
jgi:ATP-binding cassette, subfamily B, bacterial PglK